MWTLLAGVLVSGVTHALKTSPWVGRHPKAVAGALSVAAVAVQAFLRGGGEPVDLAVQVLGTLAAAVATHELVTKPVAGR